MQILKRIGLFVLGALVVAAALLAVRSIAFPARTAAAWQPGESMAALSAAADDLAPDAATQKALLQALPATCAEAGCDTLYFALNTAEGVCWRDSHFAMDGRLCRQELYGLLTTRFDALKMLADACAEEQVRLVGVLRLEDLAGTNADAALADAAFTDRLQRAVHTLCANYPLTALVLAFDGPLADTAANRAALSGIARQSTVPFGLELPAAHTVLGAADVGAAFAVARLEGAADNLAAAPLAGAALPVVWRPADAAALAGAAYYAAGQGAVLRDLVWCDARSAALQPQALPALRAQLAAPGLEALRQLALPQPPAALAAAYPADGETVYTSAVYVMGTSDPAQPLTLNGQPVQRTTQNGVFGVLAQLEPGENTLVLAQGASQQSLRVLRAEAPAAPSTQDDSPYLYEGQRIRITSWICSVLYDPHDDDRILETAKEGAIAVVNRCVTTSRAGETTHAYELASGGWVLAANCAPVDMQGPWPLETPLAPQDDGRDETLCLVRGGQALGYDSWDEDAGVLTVTLANVTAQEALLPLQSAFLQQVELTPVDGGVQLRFTVGGQRRLWGYDVCYSEQGDTLLYLRGAPQLPLAGECPLEGALILLDPGHGGQDAGAMGAAGGIGGPAEKDVNLAVALAARARLQQWGATVVLTREGDEAVSLDARSRQAAQLRPDIFLAIHHNSIALASDAGRVSGASAYYFTLPGKLLADSLLPRVCTAASRENDGANWSYYYVTRMTYAPAVLLEYGFLPNPAEYEACCDRLTILREGEATAQGILDCFIARLGGGA